MAWHKITIDVGTLEGFGGSQAAKLGLRQVDRAHCEFGNHDRVFVNTR